MVVVEFPYNIARIDALGYTPFELDIDWNLRSPLDCVLRGNSSVESIDSLRSRLQETPEDAQYARNYTDKVCFVQLKEVLTISLQGRRLSTGQFKIFLRPDFESAVF